MYYLQEHLDTQSKKISTNFRKISKTFENMYKIKGNLETTLTDLKENMGRTSKSKGTD